MDSAARLIVKAVCWQSLGLISMTLVGYVLTGSVSTGGLMAVVSSIIGFICYLLHELLWARVRWGRTDHPRTASRIQPRVGTTS